MAPEDKTETDKASDLKDSSATAVLTELAVDGQEKPSDLQGKEQEQAELRKSRRTPSSVDLPKIDLSSLGEVSDGAMMVSPVMLGVDGDSRTVDEGFRERTIYPDGSEEGYYNGSAYGYARTPDGFGGFTEQNWGDFPENNYKLEKLADGSYIVEPAPDAELSKVVDVEKDKLEQLAEYKLESPEDKEQFKQDLERFHKRSAELEDTYRKQLEADGMESEEAQAIAKQKAAEQMIGTYREIGRLLESEGETPLPSADRKAIAAQVLHNAADPTTIDQKGATCQVTTVEVRAYTRTPADAARLVADMAINGEYNARGYEKDHAGLYDREEGESGVTVTMTPDNLAADPGAQTYKSDNDYRSHASQIFQSTAVNMNCQRNGGDVRYEQRPDPETGEKSWTLVDYSKEPPEGNRREDGSYSSGTDVGNKDLSPIYNQITGKWEKTFVIERGTGGKDSENPPTEKIDSEDSLRSSLEEKKARGELPATVFVWSGKEPFYGDGGEPGPDDQSWHLVTVTDIDENGKVSIDNQWGDSNDRVKDKKVSVGQLYDSMSKN
jgi:hypothetical protein